MARLLVVEDDALLRSALAQSLKAAGYDVESAENGFKALEQAARQSFDLIISDIRMPGMDGVSALSHLKASSPRLKTILITGYADEAPIARALNLGVDGILKKPFTMKDLLQMISLKLEAYEQEQEREKKYSHLFSRISGTLGLEKAQELFGEEEPGSLDAYADERQRGATLAELGRTAQMRQEFEAAIQAYEAALGIFSSQKSVKEEAPVRLALSRLFALKGDMEFALLHAEEALSLARQVKPALFLADALQNFARLLVNTDPAKSFKFLQEAVCLLSGDELSEKQAVGCFLEARLALDSHDFNCAKAAMNKVLSFGKRHFLPQTLLSMPDIAFPPFLLALEHQIHPENARWLLEETAPCLQGKLQEAIAQKPSLKEILSGFIQAPPYDGRFALQIFTFGKLNILLEGKSLTDDHWLTLKGRSLLLYLLYQHPKMVSQENIFDVFWPQLELEKARNVLRTTLYFIRRTLPADGAQTIVYHERQKYGISHGSSFVCDFVLFRNYMKQAKTDWGKGNLDRAIFPMKEAERLYRGSFLPGWSEEWSLMAREDFKEAYLWLMLAFAGYLQKQKAWDHVSAYAQKAIEVEPACEEAHAFLMEAFLALGKREDAVRQFNVCRDLLRRELKIEPSLRLRSLYVTAKKSDDLVNA